MMENKSTEEREQETVKWYLIQRCDYLSIHTTIEYANTIDNSNF